MSTLIQVTVVLHTILQVTTPAGVVKQLNLSIPPGTTISELIQQLKIELDDEDLLVSVNNRHVAGHYRIQDTDIIHLIPAISGG